MPLWNVNRKSEVPDRSVSVPMIFTYLEMQGAQCFRRISIVGYAHTCLTNSDEIRRPNFSGYIPTYAHTFDVEQLNLV